MDLEKIKDDLRPREDVLAKISGLVDELNKEVSRLGIKASCVPGGSVAKGTFLSGDFDVDLFMRFDLSYKDKDISDMLEKLLSRYGPERIHGSRDYFQFIKDNLNFEIVPVLDISDPEKAENVTDMSPMHVKWVKKNLKKGQEDEIRLAKKFCKAARAYGAESYINGFSGHVIDILVINYGSFMSLIKNAAKWKAQVIIDIEKHYKMKREILFDMNKSKIMGPMIVVDPILRSRNAASALSYEKFSIMKKKAAMFLKKPSEKFFEEVKIGKTYLKKKYPKNLFLAYLEAGKGKRDVVGSKIVKAFKHMKKEMARKGFSIEHSGWEWNRKHNVLFWFVLKENSLPEKKVIEGPPSDMEDACSNFKKKYDLVFIKNKRLHAEIKNEVLSAEDNIRSISADTYIAEKVSLKKIEKYI